MLTAKQTNRLTAYENLDTVLQDEADVYKDDEGMQEIATGLHEHLTVLKPLRKAGVRPRKGGAREDKATAKQFLADVGGEIAGDLFSFGSKINSSTLKAEADYAPADLVKLRGTRLLDISEHLYDLAGTHATAMGKLAISDARRTEFRTAIDDFSGKKNVGRQQSGAGQATSLNTGKRFALIAELLEDRFQRALRKYKRSHPDFYARVTAAREVIDLPGSNPGPANDKPQA